MDKRSKGKAVIRIDEQRISTALNCPAGQVLDFFEQFRARARLDNDKQRSGVAMQRDSSALIE